MRPALFASLHAVLLAALASPSLDAQVKLPVLRRDFFVGCGDIHAGTIAAAGEIDYVEFRATAGDVVEITLVGTYPGGYQCADVLAPSGALVTSFCSDTLNELTAAETGRYTIRVRSFDLVFTGPYYVGLSCRAPLGPVVADLACGAVVQSEISGPAEVDYFTFEGEAGDVAEVTLVGTYPGGYQCAAVFAPSGALVAWFCGDWLEELTLLETGRYSIRVTAWDLVFTGSYHVGLSCRDPLGPVVEHLTCGELVTSAIQGPAEVDYYSFDGHAGQAVDLTLVGTFPGGYQCAAVFAPSGAMIASFCADSLQSLVLAETGQHKIRVTAWDLVFSGPYQIGLFCP